MTKYALGIYLVAFFVDYIPSRGWDMLQGRRPKSQFQKMRDNYNDS